jgi:uncharacterized lipoprotein YajG
MRGRVSAISMVVVALLAAGCQKPSDVNSFDVDLTATPNPSIAETSSGVTYVVQGDDNTPDVTKVYPYRTSFLVTLTSQDDVGADVTSVTVRVQQASGGIVVVPTGSEVERYQFNSSASNNRLEGHGSAQVSFIVWYDLPNKGKEALVTASFGMMDDDDNSWTKTVQVKVAP